MNSPATYALLSIAKYPLWATPFGFLSMAIFRLPLALRKQASFWRLMGCGRNGTFDLVPDLTQWAQLSIAHLTPQQVATFSADGGACSKHFFGRFISAWLRFCGTTQSSYLLAPLEGHGLWNGKTVFGPLPKQTDYEGEIAVLTRATIRLSKLADFWRSVQPVAVQMAGAPGFMTSYGIGEIPFVKQATFSIWQSKAAMKQFAYGLQAHKKVVRHTHQNKWYSEEMFVRFKIVARFCR
jgi:heme-degrading monooxygenase HmoA